MLAATLFLGNRQFMKKPFMAGTIQQIEIYEGQGAGKVTDFLLLGKVTDAPEISRLQSLMNSGKKQPGSIMNTNQLSDYDLRVIPEEGPDYLVHLWIDASTITFIKSVRRDTGYAVDPTVYEIRPADGEMLKLIQSATTK